MRRNEIKIMPAQLNRIAKYTTQQEFDLVRDVLSTDLKSLDKPTLKKRIRVLRRHADKARGRAVTEARKGVSGELSKRKMGIFLEALQKCEHYLLDIEVQEAREQHKAAARKALEKKRSSANRTMPRPSSRTAGTGMVSKPRTKPVPRLTAGREKGHVLGVQRRAQAKRDDR
jgi:hypothetical protein